MAKNASETGVHFKRIPEGVLFTMVGSEQCRFFSVKGGGFIRLLDARGNRSVAVFAESEIVATWQSFLFRVVGGERFAWEIEIPEADAQPSASAEPAPEPPAEKPTLHALPDGCELTATPAPCKVRVIAIEAEFDDESADLILPELLEAIEMIVSRQSVPDLSAVESETSSAEQREPEPESELATDEPSAAEKLAAVDAKLADVKGDLITGPGRYPQRDGGVAVVEHHLSDPWIYPWMGYDADGVGSTWTPGGLLVQDHKRPTDIVGPRIPDEPPAPEPTHQDDDAPHPLQADEWI